MTAPLSAAEAAQRILDEVRQQPTLRIPLDDALASVLAEEVVSRLDIPAWTNSAMDGYAARASDVRGASQSQPVRLRVVEQLPAGHFPSRSIGPGECARIFTGAPLPDGADSVIRQEDTDGGADTVTILKDRDVGVNFRLTGEDIRKGSTVLHPGAELGPAQLGVLASLAVAHPLVYRRPRVAILGSGDEIVDIDQAEAILSGRKIASSNTHTLVALVRQRPELTLVPPAALKLNLDRAEGTGQKAQTGPAVSPKPSALSPKKGGRYGNAAPSWWIARAKEAEIKPGFTKAEMTRSAKEDPRASGGLFEHVGGLLSDLLDQRP